MARKKVVKKKMATKGIKEKCFGSFGWRQFWENRLDILKEYDRLKGLNENDPMRASHGVALEAKIRKWLTTFLPKKYAVTSGYIIPDIVVNEYSLRHFDIIIYNQLESPVLWVETNEDTSSIGERKAIPAKYVNAVLEVKATLTKSNIIKTKLKLNELASFKNYLPPTFSCFSIFAEIGNDVPNNLAVLEEFADCKELFGYKSGLVLRSNADETSSGQIVVSTSEMEDNLFPTASLTSSIDELNIYINQSGNLKIAHDFAGASLCKTSESNWSATKLYSPHITKNGIDVFIHWSHNSFTRFFIELMSSLEGVTLNKEQFNFGQVYDRINLKND